MHRLLEWIGQPQSPLPRGQWAAAAAQAAAAVGLASAAAAGEVLAVVETMLRSDACRRFFDAGQLRWCGNEVPLADGGHALRIDRLVRLADAWWVLDYKLTSQPGELSAYRPQLETYRRAVAARVAPAPVRAAFITGRGEVVELGGDGTGRGSPR